MKSFVLAAAMVGLVAADIEFSRTVTQLIAGASGTVDLSSGCSGMDMYGSNDCKLQWGDNYTATADVVIPVNITTGATVSVDLKIDGLVSFKADCPVCGANCTFKVPIIDKHIDQPMPPCPLLVAGTYKNSTLISLPSPSPVPSKVSFKGTVTLKDASGTELIGLEVEGSAH